MTTSAPIPRSHSDYPSHSRSTSHHSNSASRPRSSSYNHSSSYNSSSRPHSHHSNHSHHTNQDLIPHPSPYTPSQSYPNSQQLAPYNPTAQTLQPYSPQTPTYSRNPSHHSHHSHHSHSYSHEEERVSDYDRDRKIEKRPTIGDTMVVIWRSVLGAFDRRK